MSITEPLHIAQVGGRRFRFFRTPLNDGKPDMPWYAIEDLHQCLRLNRDQRRVLLRRFRARFVQAVATAEGIVNIAPHLMAQGTIDAMIEMGLAPASVRADYDLAGSEALQKLCAHLEFPSDAWMAWMKAAMNRHERGDAAPTSA